jgi:aminoglycoside phosphotransferase (APT) family kinase protein
MKAPLELTPQCERIANRIDETGLLGDDEKQAARQRLSELPDGEAICHGDFHPGNILLTRRGPGVIDWMSGTRGHPLGDVAQTSLLFDIAKLPDDAPAHIRILMKVSRQLLHTNYLRRYLQLSTGTKQEIDVWRPALMATRGAWPANKAR